jgi:hypothetical protein
MITGTINLKYQKQRPTNPRCKHPPIKWVYVPSYETTYDIKNQMD